MEAADCGDEKLLRLFRESNNIRVVFSKPHDRVGLWFYELALIILYYIYCTTIGLLNSVDKSLFSDFH